jgi:hypothetical protein
VLQEWQNITASDGRKALVIYSTGNFISAQRGVAERTGIIAILSLAKEVSEPKAHLSAVHYILTRIVDTSHGPSVVDADEAATDGPLPPAGRVSSNSFQSGGAVDLPERELPPTERCTHHNFARDREVR